MTSRQPESVEQILERLRATTAAQPPASPEEAPTHLLGLTLDADREADDLVAAASVRTAASQEAIEIIEQARSAAGRLVEEARRHLETSEATKKEAAAIRADAVSRAAAVAREMRDEAHELLVRTHALADETNASIHSMTTTIGSYLETLRTRTEAIGELLYEVAVREQARVDQHLGDEIS